MSAVDESPPKLWAEFKKPRDVDAQVIQSMRVFWYRGDAVDPRTKLPIRRLRFAREGEMDGTTWARHVAALLGNRLPHDLAPCVWHGGDTGEVRSVSRREIDWEGIEEREWRMLRASGLDAMTQHRLIAGEHDEPSEPADLAADEAAEVEPTDVDVEADREERRAAVRGLLEHLPEGPIVARVEAATEAVREAILADALAEAQGNRVRASELLGAPQERVTEWLRKYPHIAAAWPARRGRPPTARE